MGAMKGWKTVVYAGGILLAVLTVPQVQEFIGNYPTAAVFVNSVLVVALRFITTTPIFDAGPQPPKA